MLTIEEMRAELFTVNGADEMSAVEVRTLWNAQAPMRAKLPKRITDTDRLEAVASRRLHLRPPGDHDPLWIAYEGVYYAESLEWKGETFRDAIDAAIRGAKP